MASLAKNEERNMTDTRNNSDPSDMPEIPTMHISESCGFGPKLEDWLRSQGVDPASLRGTRVRYRSEMHSLEMFPIDYSFDDMAKGLELRDELGNWLRSRIDFPEDAAFICQLVIASLILGYGDEDEDTNDRRLKACDRNLRKMVQSGRAKLRLGISEKT
jgi:hypothetical protein